MGTDDLDRDLRQPSLRQGSAAPEPTEDDGAPRHEHIEEAGPPDLDSDLRHRYWRHGGTDVGQFAEDVAANLANLRPGAHPRTRPRHWQRSRLQPELEQLAMRLAALSPEARTWLSYTRERPGACVGDPAAACLAERQLLRQTEASDLVDELKQRALLPIPSPLRMDPLRWECAWTAEWTLSRHDLPVTTGRDSLFVALLKHYLHAAGIPDSDPYRLARDYLDRNLAEFA